MEGTCSRLLRNEPKLDTDMFLYEEIFSPKQFHFLVCSEFTHTQGDFTFTHVLWHMYTQALMCRDSQQTDTHTNNILSTDLQVYVDIP